MNDYTTTVMINAEAVLANGKHNWKRGPMSATGNCMQHLLPGLPGKGSFSVHERLLSW